MVRERFASILNGNLSLNPVVMPNLFPKFLKVTNKGQANYVNELESKPNNILILEDLKLLKMQKKFFSSSEANLLSTHELFLW